MPAIPAPVNSDVRGLVKVSNWIWTRIGFGAIAITAGTIWFLIFYPLMICDFNRSMQHLVSNSREEDVANEETSIRRNLVATGGIGPLQLKLLEFG